MKILSLDSATQSATCAILDDNKVLGEITFNYKKQHSQILMPIIDELFKNTQMSIDDIDAFVASKGPGSFTGLRIGMATIKGLSQGTNKPFVTVSTLDSLAYNLAYTDGIICPILDALRDNVYTALYTFEDKKLNRISDYINISIDELITMLKDKDCTISFVGDGTLKFKEKLITNLPNVSFAPDHLNLAKATSLGELGLKLLSNGTFDDIYASVPIYLRKPQAEREYEEKMRQRKNE
ncbi:tRNA (adenosine(37)-N6)-threonylcarbamoyltransferase complex dimerization subunit type 1 TsaB [Clostridium estertheticum]|uniref:tRNA N6-adenosine(37)-N6-threonylcarbamoyltransferase complex dimerization subunit TsaB n=1 Tax=Clostridium estertheticum subsp. estertheticum TaxID=1552 RepID=A0A1J0GC06_9CLOT|nr:tRNA (adenosine(37)-N6)-threonylcarbamoyltransferase complex dimerization subunit type 1 TsaB [Clostridium estertheticum]APC38811.1 tRNA N6-adenosine(37)-N6-threonylcarbamoyltransferase complex dimerization subunit TsaB [Clostridium estertheticum subsp. estertheticum]MBZ9615249.1 tRNA (adenosine(37)-N6)-threonylcarbamoyltransferase complex dimerization subunit type 1 TsaB [Clostridium estertheticum subsp. laramiense]WAG75138.1 tRNA (adenosine(37)-N6)-threonylcarbamoyltransferase complex dimer